MMHQPVPSTDQDHEEHHHEASSSSSPNNTNNSNNKLALWQGVALLTADCLGVGVLALPNDVAVLGYGLGLTFLILNFPINFYAGDLLSVMALQLEQQGVPTTTTTTTTSNTTHSTTTTAANTRITDEYDLELHEEGGAGLGEEDSSDGDGDGDHDHPNKKQVVEMTSRTASAVVDPALDRSPTMFHRHSKTGSVTTTTTTTNTSNGTHSYYTGIPKAPINKLVVHQLGTSIQKTSSDSFQDEPLSDHDDDDKKDDEDQSHDDGVHEDEEEEEHDDEMMSSTPQNNNNINNDDTINITYDLIGISKAIFDSPSITRWVILIYYLNLFLVLGDYILVMGRAVSALFLDQNICLPTAGAIASLLMFAICQLRTMALLGRNVSLASLLAMVVVLIQCLFHHRTSSTTSSSTTAINDVQLQQETNTEDDIWARFSALASIGFAVGSQKLFLNIRHELACKEEASKVLAGSLSTYGGVYLVVILLAGPNPPSFLFDAIPEGWSRRVAGLLLWGHVAVSYAINSQALCSSMDRFWVASSYRAQHIEPRIRWFLLTLTVAVSSYLVSNAVPFFKDLVALIGALTSVPLTLTLPALLHRHFHRLWLCIPHHCWSQWTRRRRRRANDESSSSSCGSYSLLLYSLAFLAVGLTGALSSIDEDWLSHGRPFSCR